MIEHKFDEEIKQALEICSRKDCDCKGCTYTTPEKGTATCTDLLMRDALYLVNKRERQIVELTDKHGKQLMQILEKVYQI